MTEPKMRARVYKTKVLKLLVDHVVRYATATRVWWRGPDPSRLSIASGEHFRITRIDRELAYVKAWELGREELIVRGQHIMDETGMPLRAFTEILYEAMKPQAPEESAS